MRVLWRRRDQELAEATYRRTSMWRLVGSALVTLVASACVGGNAEDSALRDGWKRVTYEEVSFAVPEDWPVQDLNVERQPCGPPPGQSGVFLQRGEPVGFSCPGTDEYAATLTVGSFTPTPGGAGRMTVVGDQDAVVRSHDDNLWLEAVLPEVGLLLTFYEVPERTRQSILDSVEAHDR
jgi:hypothetical protein